MFTRITKSATIAYLQKASSVIASITSSVAAR